MLTGMLAARNIVLNQRHYLWNVNTDQEYLEEIVPENGTGTDSARAALTRATLRAGTDRSLAPGSPTGNGQAGAAPTPAARRAER